MAIIIVFINFIPVKNETQYSWRLFISLIFLFFFGALRIDFGLDYKTYEDYFYSVKVVGFWADARMEVGYFYLNKILPTFRSLLVLQSILMCIAYFYLFKRYIPSKYAWFGFLLLFLSGSLTIYFMLSGIRNGIAISIFILSCNYLEKRKIVPYTILIIVAFLFHNSVVLYAPIAYFLAKGNPITKRSLIAWLLVSVFITFTSSTVIFKYTNILITAIFDRYSTYVELVKAQNKGAGLLVSTFSLVAITILLLLFKEKKMKKKESMILNLTLLFYLAFLFGSLNMRMSQYFVSFFIAGSVIVLSRGKSKLFKKVYLIIVFAYLIYSIIIWIKNPYFSYSIYHSILFKL